MDLLQIDNEVNYDYMTKCWEINNCVQENLTIGKTNWRYRGEGNANIVIALEDEVTIIRLSKHDINGRQVSLTTKHKKKVDRQVIFTRHIFAPLLGSECVAKVHAVYIENIDQLNEILQKLRPRNRMHKDLKVPYATAQSDFARISDHSSLSNHVDYCIEIKPKKGWWVKSNTENIGDLRPNLCTYCLNQYHKLKKGKISSRSNYCPLDLFSGKPILMVNAVISLLSNPQNNLRIFRDGCLIYSETIRDKSLQTSSLNTLISEWLSTSNLPLTSTTSKVSGLNSFVYLICLALIKPMKSNADSTDAGIHQYFKLKKELKQLLLSHTIVEQTCGNEINYVLHDKFSKDLSKKTCCNQENVTLPVGSVLSRILYAQKLEDSDPSHVKKIYRKICPIHADIHNGSQLQLTKNNNKLIETMSNEVCPNNKCVSTEIYCDEVQTNILSPKELMSLQRNVLAATVKDCSLMLTLSPITNNTAAATIVSPSTVSPLSLPNGVDVNGDSDCNLEDEINGSILHDLYQGFHFSRIGIVDLDPKPLSSVVKHNFREANILQSYYASSDFSCENST